MIISPPFLSQPNVPVYDEQCVRDVMPGGIVGSGAFPVSQAMGWHGGIHIHALAADEPVRAIADGTVIFSRAAGNARYDGQDNSTGCVVIRHKTDIGADGAIPVEVVFYSIYQHLRRLEATLPAVHQPVYRKDRLGLAGTIHGQANRIHLEIVAGDADTVKLVGRSTGDLNAAQDGRSNAVFGRVYIVVPSGSAFYTAQPTGATRPAAAGSTTEELVVALEYNAGNATLSTHKPAGGDPLFTLPAETNAEYNLYAEAITRHARNTAGSSPSGWYELLRFGRNLGGDPLPANAAHWRKAGVPGHPNGVWLDLNAAGTHKFSDSDMPHWAGWKLVDDDSQDDNSQCNSALIDAMLAPSAQTVAQPASPPNLSSPPAPAAQSPETPQTTPEQKANNRKQNLCNPAVQEKLARTICKFPTEWAKDDVRSRWEWTRKTGNPYMPSPLEDEADFTEMTDFAQKLCFWEQLPAEDQTRLTKKHWHFHPTEFINHFRKCGWLSRVEMLQLLPMNSLRSSNGWHWERVEISGAVGLLSQDDPVARERRIALNMAFRKYCVNTPVRLACFFGNSTQETQWFQKFHENSPYWYRPWDGRGFLQLTHADNYIKYWNFRSISIAATDQTSLRQHTVLANTSRKGGMTDPTNSLSDASTGISQSTIDHRNDLGLDAIHRAQSAGAYWAWSGASKEADGYLINSVNTSVTKSTIISSSNKIAARHYYENSAFGNVAATVNLGTPSTRFASIWGIQARFMAFANAQVILLDNALFPRNSGGSNLLPEDFTFRRP